MLTIIFVLLLIGLVISIVKWAIKAAWGIIKMILSIVLIPAILVFLVIEGFIYIAVPLLIIFLIISLVGGNKR